MANALESRHQYVVENHRLERFVFANGTDQSSGANLFTPSGIAYTIVVADVGQICYRSDTGAYYRLVSIGPLVWALIGGGGSSTTGDVYSAENKDAATVSAGMVVAVHSSGTGVIHANATTNSENGVGLAQADILTTVSGNIQTDGLLTLTDWTAVIGSTTLSAAAIYYLDTTDGLLTTMPSSTAGNVTQQIGIAVSPTMLEIAIQPAILL